MKRRALSRPAFLCVQLFCFFRFLFFFFRACFSFSDGLFFRGFRSGLFFFSGADRALHFFGFARRGRFFCHFHFFLKLLHAPRRVDELLFAGIERMAVTAQFDADFLHGRTHGKTIPAGAGNGGAFKICWMDIFFHRVRRVYRRALSVSRGMLAVWLYDKAVIPP